MEATADTVQMYMDILKIIGWILGFLLSINAWYFKEMVKKLSSIELEMVKLTTEHSLMTSMVEKHDKKLDRLEMRMAKVEGAVKVN